MIEGLDALPQIQIQIQIRISGIVIGDDFGEGDMMCEESFDD